MCAAVTTIEERPTEQHTADIISHLTSLELAIVHPNWSANFGKHYVRSFD